MRTSILVGIVIFSFFLGNQAFCAPKSNQLDSSVREDIEKEILLGRSVAGKLIAAFGLLGDKKVNNYITLLGQSIARNSDVPNRKYTFSVLNTSHVNAYSAPGGYVFITRGALKRAKNEAQLAAILGHEIAHITKEHVYKTVKKLTADDKKLSKEMKTRMRPSDNAVTPKTAGTVVSKIVGVKGTAAVALFKAMTRAAYDLLVNKGIDQKYEYEADKYGVIYSLRAGYSPKALQDYLKKLNLKHKNQKRLYKTHPPLKTRITKLNEYIKKNDLIAVADGLGKKRFAGIKKRLAKAK